VEKEPILKNTITAPTITAPTITSGYFLSHVGLRSRTEGLRNFLFAVPSRERPSGRTILSKICFLFLFRMNGRIDLLFQYSIKRYQKNIDTAPK
jgi:hypothetical protein